MGGSTSSFSVEQTEELTKRRLKSAICICGQDSKALRKCLSLCVYSLYTLVHVKVASSQSDKGDHCQVYIRKRRKIPLIQYKVDLYVPLGFQQE